MNRRLFLMTTAAAAALGASGAAFALDATDRTIVPGQRVGAITKATPPAALAKIFGTAKVRYAQVPIAEGDKAGGAYILAKTQDELQVGFHQNKKRIEFIRIVGRNWKTENGIHIGSSLADLERINGAPFELSGFDWDYGGIVQRRAQDKLSKDLAITLRPTKNVTEAENNQVSGDRKLPSSHPVLKKMGVVVSSLVISWPDGR